MSGEMMKKRKDEAVCQPGSNASKPSHWMRVKDLHPKITCTEKLSVLQYEINQRLSYWLNKKTSWQDH